MLKLKKMKIKINNRLIGTGEPCFIIAEAGINHNGDIQLAKKLVDVAKKANVDAIKFQTYKSEEVAIKDIGLADYAKKNIKKNLSQLDMIKLYELQYDDFIVLKEYCDKKKIIFLSTPHSFDAIDFLEKIVPAYKFGSGDITNIPALKYAAKKGKPIILGTGMSILKEVKSAIKAIISEGNNQIIVLHCTTNYPCPFEEVNLKAMVTMQWNLNCIVGYSDHTLGIIVPIMAVALGASVIEKHFTMDRNLPGPDHKASLEPEKLQQMVESIRNVEKALGSDKKKPTISEKEIMRLVRKSIVSKQEIDKGTILKREMLTIKRPGTGMQSIEIEKLIGKKTKRQIFRDEIFSSNMVE